MAHDVFISYSSKDKTTADAVCARMERGGVRCWYAPRDIAPGADWAGSIIDAINTAKVMVLIFTPDSNISVQVLRELDCAVAAGVTIIPMRLTKEAPIDEMRYYLSAVHWLDAVDADLERSIDELYSLVKAVVDSKPESVVPTAMPDSGKKGKKNSKGLLIGIIAAAAAAVIIAVLVVPGILKEKNGPSGAETADTQISGADTAGTKTDEIPSDITLEDLAKIDDPEEAEGIEEALGSLAPTAEALGADAPVGEKSENAGTEPEAYVESTTQSNLIYGGHIAYADGWYYFLSDDEKLYKMREDGSDAQKISDRPARNIMVHDGHVFFNTEHGDAGIFRIDPDGENELMIYGSNPDFMGIIDDKLYFVDSLDGLCVFDLTEEMDDSTWGGEPLYYDETVMHEIYKMCFDGKNIYYTSFDKEGLFRVPVDGGEPEQLVEGEVYDPVLAGDYLYYKAFSSAGTSTIEAYDLNTKEVITAVPYSFDYYHVRSDGIYGTNCDVTEKYSGYRYLVRYDPSTGITYQLSDREVVDVCLVHEKIWYWDFNKHYATDLQGKNVITL